MKLKVRAAILSCAFLSFCAIFIAIHELPTLPDRKVTLLSQYKAGRSFEELEDHPHIFTFRKRLNKSNYTSENISPDIDKPPAVVSTVTNETVEYIKEKDESIQGDNHFAEEKALHNKESAIEGKANESFNSSDPAVDKLIYLLQTANGLKFGFEKTKDIPYYRILRQIAKRTRRKGIGLPIYRNYYGGFVYLHTVKPVWSGHSKIDKAKVLYKGSLMKVESIAECSSILQYF